MSKPSQSYFGRPLAPASMPVLAGVSAFAAVGLTTAALVTASDIGAVAGFFVVLVVSAIALDVSGRKRAEREPNKLYRPERLPNASPRLKRIIVVLIFLALLVYAFATATPGQRASPLPYFLAAGFIFVVLPQLLARRTVRRSVAKR